MPDEVNFVDLVALSRITPDTYAEKFGGMINSSFFDASNILATLRQKGLIDFTTSFPGQSAITVTDLGKKVLADAIAGGAGEFGHLDFEILTQLSNGKRSIQDLSGGINIRPTDLAMHLYKLGQQQYLTYEFRNGMVTLTLTEKGFVQARSGMPILQPQPQGEKSLPSEGQEARPLLASECLPENQRKAQPGAAAQPMNMAGQTAAPAGAQAQQPTVDINQLEASIKAAKMKRLYYAIALVVVVMIAVIAAVMMNLIKL